MNKVYLIGNLKRDPELSETPSGIALCRFSIAVNRNYSSSDGERQTDFFNITVWRTQAENCGRYLKKGSKVAIVGSLQNRSYEDKDGNKRTVTDIVLLIQPDAHHQLMGQQLDTQYLQLCVQTVDGDIFLGFV